MLESIASFISLDISQIEARHATNREITLMRARGWYPSLEYVTASFVTRFQQHLGDWRWRKSRDSKEEADKDKQTTEKHSKKKKKKGGGGGAWRAFIHEKASGERFDRGLNGQSIGGVAAENRALTPEQKARYVNAGRMATHAHAQGFKAFASSTPSSEQWKNTLQSKWDSEETLISDQDEDLWRVVADTDKATLMHPSLLYQYQGCDSFGSRYSLAKAQIKELAKQQDQHSGTVLSEEDQEQLAIFNSQLTDKLVTDLTKSHCDLGGAFSKVNEDSSYAGFQWSAPITSLLKAPWQNVLLLFI